MHRPQAKTTGTTVVSALAIFNSFIPPIQAIKKAIPRHLWRKVETKDARNYPHTTDWKFRLRGHTNGARECARRLKQVEPHTYKATCLKTKETALLRFEDGMPLVQMDDLKSPRAHGWHRLPNRVFSLDYRVGVGA